MNSTLFFILLLLVSGVAVFGMTATPKTAAPLPTKTPIVKPSQLPALLTQSRTMGVVSVDVTPAFTKLENKVEFKVDMNNHSIDLAYDFTEIATLTDDQGNTYTPSEWTGNSGGHHVSGLLVFPALTDNVKQLTLTLTGVDNETSDFRWEL